MYSSLLRFLYLIYIPQQGSPLLYILKKKSARVVGKNQFSQNCGFIFFIIFCIEVA
jgi:hypothetical protein